MFGGFSFDQFAHHGGGGFSGGTEGGGGGGGEPANTLFDMFFGGGGRRGGSAGPRKGPLVQHHIKVSLEDLYNGKTVKLAINQKVIQGDVKECKKCHGRGVVMEVCQLGPGMITQKQSHCPICDGQGLTAPTKSVRKVLEVNVEKGMCHNEKVTFRGMADETPGIEPGDMHFIIHEKEHKLFKRKGADLLVTNDVTLNQPLTGFTWKVKHLDGRQLVITTRPGQVIESGITNGGTGRTLPFIMMVKDEGMPSQGNPFVKGNLYVAFHAKSTTTLMPDVEEDYDPKQVEEYFLDIADLQHFGKGGAVVHNNKYDCNDEGGGQAVQYQQS